MPDRQNDIHLLALGHFEGNHHWQLVQVIQSPCLVPRGAWFSEVMSAIYSKSIYSAAVAFLHVWEGSHSC